MEFIEFDSFQDNDIPQPQPSLSIPVPSNIENLPFKLPKLNNLKSFLQFDDDGNRAEVPEINEINEINEKYAEMSMKVVNQESYGQGDDSKHQNITDGVDKDQQKQDSKYLSNKLSKVLNNSIDDSLIKELFTLDLNEGELIDSNLIGSLSRKNLRSKIEMNLIKNQSIILKEYQPTIKLFKNVESKLHKLNSLNNLNNAKIDEIFNHLNQFNGEFNNLKNSKIEINLKKNLLTSFKKNFLLNEFEEFIINNNEINDEFFKVIEKLDLINENSSILLSIDNSNLGMKIIEKLNKFINKSNDTLYQFAKRTLINPNLNFNHEKLIKFQKVLNYLQIRNINMYNQLIKDFSNDRSKVLIEEFNKQLGNDQINGDITRYIGDLLAFLHTMVLNEIELINSIFNNDVHQSNNLLNLIFSKISNSLKSNFETIIAIELNFKIIYSIFNLFDLYKLMFNKKFNDNQENSLIITLNELIEFCQMKLLDLVSNKLKSIKSSNSAKLDLNTDLQPPEWIIDFYSQILPIIEQSKLNFNSILNLEGDKLHEFLNKIIDEPIEIFNSHLKSKNFNNFEKIIIKINFIDLMLSKILPINLLNDKIIELNDLIQDLKIELSNIQYDDILKNCYLYDFEKIINMIMPLDSIDDDDFMVEIYEPIKENKLFTTQEINKVNDAISEYLPNTLMEIQRNLSKLNNPIVSNDVTEICSIKFIKFIIKFNLIIKGYLNKSVIWNDLEIATLLGVEEIYPAK